MTSNTDTSKMLTQLKLWVRAGLIPEEFKKATSSLTEDTDDFVVECVFNKVKEVVRGEEAKKKAEDAITDKAGELWGDLLAEKKETDWTEYFEEEEIHGNIKLVLYNEDFAGWIAFKLDELYEEQLKKAKAEANPVKKPKTSGSKKDQYNKDAPHHIHEDYTKEKAIALYEEEGFYFNQDKEEGCVFEEKKKYKVGQRNPIGEGKLTEEMYMVKYKPVIRSISFCDKDDKNRCQAAVAFKPMRHASKYAKSQGIVGDCVVQCSEKTSKGMCDKCAKLGKTNFFEYKYKKSGRLASSYYTADTVGYKLAPIEIPLNAGDDA